MSKLTPVAADEWVETRVHVEPAHEGVHRGELRTGTHTYCPLFVLLTLLRQMIDVADTITTCAELEDNISIMSESKLFLKLQDAMDAMQQDHDMSTDFFLRGVSDVL